MCWLVFFFIFHWILIMFPVMVHRLGIFFNPIRLKFVLRNLYSNNSLPCPESNPTSLTHNCNDASDQTTTPPPPNSKIANRSKSRELNQNRTQFKHPSHSFQIYHICETVKETWLSVGVFHIWSMDLNVGAISTYFTSYQFTTWSFGKHITSDESRHEMNYGLVL